MEILDIENLVTQTLELFCVDVSPNYCSAQCRKPVEHRQDHRRRTEIEDKAKVVASDWGSESLPS